MHFGHLSLVSTPVPGDFNNLAKNIVRSALGIANALSFLCICEG